MLQRLSCSVLWFLQFSKGSDHGFSLLLKWNSENFRESSAILLCVLDSHGKKSVTTLWWFCSTLCYVRQHLLKQFEVWIRINVLLCREHTVVGLEFGTQMAALPFESGAIAAPNLLCFSANFLWHSLESKPDKGFKLLSFISPLMRIPSMHNERNTENEQENQFNYMKRQ